MSPDLQVVAAMAARQSQNRQPFDHSKGSFLRKTTSWADGREMELFVAGLEVQGASALRLRQRGGLGLKGEHVRTVYRKGASRHLLRPV